VLLALRGLIWRADGNMWLDFEIEIVRVQPGVTALLEVAELQGASETSLISVDSG
jgi:hypothetical protein